MGYDDIEHDEQCEADFVEGAYAWTPCRCTERGFIGKGANDGTL